MVKKSKAPVYGVKLWERLSTLDCKNIALDRIRNFNLKRSEPLPESEQGPSHRCCEDARPKSAEIDRCIALLIRCFTGREQNRVETET
jgi:hypothetical protein